MKHRNKELPKSNKSFDIKSILLNFTLGIMRRSPMPYSQQIVEDTERRDGKWGVNYERLICPSCGKQQPIMRMPRTLQQLLWGGTTCSCGAEMNKWGRHIE